MIGRYHVGQLFISGVENLDPTLAVVLDRPRLGRKYKNSPCQGRCLLGATVRERTVQISAKPVNVRTARFFASRKARHSWLHAISVGLSFSYPDITGARVRFCVFTSTRLRTTRGHDLYCRTQETVFLFMCLKERREADCIIFPHRL